ncbi:MAG: hypothetical protein HUU45_11945, partial [Leptospiraceae bacterium]|nr:hypothetical protein [Leptospiraceae bacterium]
MGEFDRTKKAIGVGSMDDKSKAEMFKKFQTAGGKVVKDKPQTEKQDNSKISSNQRQGTSPNRQRSQSDDKNSKSKEKAEIKLTPKELQKLQEAEMENFLNRFIVKFKCWMSKVTSFGSSDLLPQFMSEMNLNGKKALMELNMVGNDIFGNPDTGNKITKELDKVTPLYVELLARGHKLYDSSELTDFFESYLAATDLSIPISKVSAPLYSIFKKLYYMYPFQSNYRKAVIAAYEALQKIEGKPALIYTTKKKKVNQEIDTLFGPIFDKLYLAILRNENKNIPLNSSYLEDLLGIVQEEKPGVRQIGEGIPESAGGVVEEKIEDTVQDEKKEEAPQTLSKELMHGNKLMAMYTLEQLRKKHDPKGEYSEIVDNDKALLSYLYFKEFDYEYSFVLTTKKIDLKPTQINGAKVDFRQKLLDIYELTRNCMEQFKIYLDVCKELTKHKQNPGSNYIESSKKTTAIEQKKSMQSRSVRYSIKEFLEKSKDSLIVLISDMKGKKEIVGNMDATLTFDAMESKK